MAIVKHIKSRNTNYSVDIDNMYEFASSHCTDFKDLRDDEDCIFRKNCASVPEERSAIPLQTEQSSAG